MEKLEKKINIFSIDGLNRCGKGTQTYLLKKEFQNRGYLCEILRGDGSRPGRETKGIYDPLSDYWQSLKSKIYKKEESTDRLWNEACYHLNQENLEFLNEIFPYKLKKSNARRGIILLDRSHLSSYFVLLQKKDTDFSEVSSSNFVHPDHYFILDVPKEELLSRNTDNSEGKLDFRRRIINENYETFYYMLQRLPTHIRKKVSIIDGCQEIDRITSNIYKKITQITNG